ncbi:ATP-dependent protease subunit HslV [Candidatus Palauibacter sp.]|uniref:ATP-dependent protease subunit HslV n=1 Tax=Candidatus Palauibacter sp. TaxID=3101350 RepID=UPI003AF3037B
MMERNAVGSGRVRATTILCVRVGGEVAMAGDGQVTMGETIVKARSSKLRTMRDGRILAGFAGGVADALTLFEKFEAQLERHPRNLARAAVELAKEWRSDRYLRRLEAVLAVADRESSLMVAGTGEVIEPDDGILALGSGGPYALAAGRALARRTDLSAAEVARQALEIAAEICVYTNEEITVIELAASQAKGT